METGIETGTPAFGVQARSAGGVTELHVAGRLVAGHGAAHPVWHTASDWRGASRLVVDLAGVTALDAGGLGALLRLRESAGRHGVAVMLRRAGPRVRRMLQDTRLDGVFRPAETDGATGLPRGLLSRCA